MTTCNARRFDLSYLESRTIDSVGVRVSQVVRNDEARVNACLTVCRQSSRLGTRSKPAKYDALFVGDTRARLSRYHKTLADPRRMGRRILLINIMKIRRSGVGS